MNLNKVGNYLLSYNYEIEIIYVFNPKIESVGMTLAKVNEKDGMTLADHHMLYGERI